MREQSVLRGGSWNNNDNNCRVANRNRNNRNNSNNNNGFRLINTAYVRICVFLRKSTESTYLWSPAEFPVQKCQSINV